MYTKLVLSTNCLKYLKICKPNFFYLQIEWNILIKLVLSTNWVKYIDQTRFIYKLSEMYRLNSFYLQIELNILTKLVLSRNLVKYIYQTRLSTNWVKYIDYTRFINKLSEIYWQNSFYLQIWITIKLLISTHL